MLFRSKVCKFVDVVPAMLAFQESRVKRGELSAASMPILRNRLHNNIVPFFGQMPIDQVGFQQLSDFMDQLGQQELSTTTIQQHMVAVRKVLAHAQGNNLIQHIPRFPSIKVVNKPRGSFSVTEYRDLVRIARQ